MNPLLLPIPREFVLNGAGVPLPSSGVICIQDASLLFEAQRAQQALREWANFEWGIVAAPHSNGLVLAIVPALPHEQGYTLWRRADTIAGKDAAGVFTACWHSCFNITAQTCRISRPRFQISPCAG